MRKIAATAQSPRNASPPITPPTIAPVLLLLLFAGNGDGLLVITTVETGALPPEFVDVIMIPDDVIVVVKGEGDVVEVPLLAELAAPIHDISLGNS
jgi:hypothetical protein